tara:strand:+ start:26 stop:655 length:630 start_codon:yes stop_codon:yes gene_type:complete
MNYPYLKPMFIHEPIYPGFHSFFYAYEVELKDRNVICQIQSDVDYNMNDTVIVYIGQSIELGIIIKIKSFNSKEIGLQIYRLSMLDNYNNIYNNKYLFESYVLFRYRKLLQKEFPDNKFGVSFHDAMIDLDDKKIIIYYSTIDDKYWNFREFIKSCFKVEKCRVEFIRNSTKEKNIKAVGELKKSFKRKGNKFKKSKEYKSLLEPIIEN